jgi:drug/metabolite transporter (DMT)-like permease
MDQPLSIPAAASLRPTGPGFRARLTALLPDLTLVFITMVWGVTFLVTQTGLRSSGPFAFLGARFAFAAIVLSAVSWRTLRRLTIAEVRAGALIGACIATGFACQTIGLMTIASSKSAFLTALYVPLVPLLEWVVFRKRLAASTWLGILMAFVGLVCLAGPQGLSFTMGRGEWLTVLCALITAAEILLIGRLTTGADSRRMAVVQLVVAAGLSFGAMAAFGEAMPHPTAGFWACALGLGVASAFIQSAMNWAQKTVSATRATIIYTLEPVWAGMVGRLAGERLTALGLTGAALIITSVLASELPRALKMGRPAAPPND